MLGTLPEIPHTILKKILDCSDFHLYIYSMKEESLNFGKTKRAAIRNISEVYFGYNAEMDGYANLSSDISELSASLRNYTRE